MGVGGVNVERYPEYLQSQGAVTQLARGLRGGRDGQIVRVDSNSNTLPEGFRTEAARIRLAMVTTRSTTITSCSSRWASRCPSARPTGTRCLSGTGTAKTPGKSHRAFQKYVPGCEKAFIARTSPSLNIRRARVIGCDYDITRSTCWTASISTMTSWHTGFTTMRRACRSRTVARTAFLTSAARRAHREPAGRRHVDHLQP